MPDLEDFAPWPEHGTFITILSIYARKIGGDLYKVVSVDATMNEIKLQHTGYKHFYWIGTYQQLIDEFYLR